MYLMIVGVCAPIWEEFIFRGFLLPSLARWMPVPAAILASASFFALAHAQGAFSLCGPSLPASPQLPQWPSQHCRPIPAMPLLLSYEGLRPLLGHRPKLAQTRGSLPVQFNLKASEGTDADVTASFHGPSPLLSRELTLTP